MTSPIPTEGRRFGAKSTLAALAVIVVLVALLTPESPTGKGGSSSTYSVSPGGARMSFELAQRMGWRTERRLAPLDSTVKTPTVQAVLAPEQALGAHEVHRLLANVRRGGGLIFTLDGEGEIADSLGIVPGLPGRFLSGYGDPGCATPASFADRTLLALPPEIRQIKWTRPPPGPTVPIGMSHARMDAGFPVVIGFPLGAGRVVVASSGALFGNDAVRLCGMGADVVVARTFEYVKPPTGERPVLVFDEFHHGFGMHGGTLMAITRYLGVTASGHFLTQALIAGLLLVLAMAPRPITPRDPERVARRSPLEHADALGQAYADVGATRTATSRLVGGLRRRAGRIVAVSGSADDRIFLDAVAGRFPALSAQTAIVRRALTDSVPTRELVAVGDALRDIERHLTTSPSSRS